MTQHKTVRKWFWVWEYEKEEQWLNAMAQSGWLLDQVGFAVYHFVSCEPGEYTVRLEMHGADDGYIDFVRETGAEYIGRMVSWVYFRKKSELGSFDLYSDLDSKLAHMDRIGKMLSIVGGINLLIGLANSLNPAVNFGWVNLLCATLLMYALGRIHGQREGLKKDRMLLE